MAKQPQATIERRIVGINAALLQESGMIEEYDDIRTRGSVKGYAQIPGSIRLPIKGVMDNAA